MARAAARVAIAGTTAWRGFAVMHRVPRDDTRAPRATVMTLRMASHRPLP
jgi:hypothetical protein